MLDYIVCGAAICLMVYAWGRLKKRAALGKFSEAKEHLTRKEYREALLLYQEIAGEMRYETEYWYDLAITLAAMGSKADSLSALEKLFRLTPEHGPGRKLEHALKLN
ncbi:MAG: hypothetical protein LBC93_07505 [Synergistaceae bacterium]|jgi:tetratricopeptide (TPR) repeat protein|nr:hypothetical protein [Synergistaceae bacterium]